MNKVELRSTPGSLAGTQASLAATPEPAAAEHRSNATFPEVTSTFERVAEAERLVHGGDAKAARALASEIRAGLPTGYLPDADALADLLFTQKPADPDAALEALTAGAAAAFEADPIRNRGFKLIDIENVRTKLGLVEHRAELQETEARIRQVMTETDHHYERAGELSGLMQNAERLEAGPEVVALATKGYEQARDAYIAEKIAIFDDATNVGNAKGLLAVGFSRMHKVGGARQVVIAAAQGIDPLDSKKRMPPSSEAQRAGRAYYDMLENTYEAATKEWLALVAATKKAKLAQAYELIEGDTSLGYSVLDMAYRRLGRVDQLVPLSLMCAELELNLTRLALAARRTKESDLGVTARRAEHTFRVLTLTKEASPEVRALAAHLQKEADVLGDQIMSARAELPS